jgi:hypothetical protein
MVSLKEAVTTELGHTPPAPLGGAAELAVSTFAVGVVAVVFELLHPAPKASSRNTGTQIL